MIEIGRLYRFHSLTEPTEVEVPADGTIVKVLAEDSPFPDEHRMYICAAEGDDATFPAFDDELKEVDNG